MKPQPPCPGAFRSCKVATMHTSIWNAVLPVPRGFPSVTPTLSYRQRGFTLTEMAVVLVITSLLIGGMIVPMSAQQDIKYNTETQKQLADISEALIGFAASKVKPYLPCPDSTGDGLEDRVGGICTAQEGNLPWQTLGIGRQDAWGNAFRYRVAAAFSGDMTGFSLSSAGDIRVCDSSACTTILASAIPAVVLSMGKNGAATPTDTDELKNKTYVAADPDFVQHTQTGGNAGFDDLVIWLPSSILINRMISAGRLP
jgi:prepilin-type N-terminal cleavage/methylation domain-containing protein